MPPKKLENSGVKSQRIFIVDDHPVFREGLSKVIGQEPDLEVCGEADTAAEAFSKIDALVPDLVMLLLFLTVFGAYLYSLQNIWRIISHFRQKRLQRRQPRIVK